MTDPHARQTTIQSLSWSWSREQLRAWQLERLNRQLSAILPANRFYREKFSSNSLVLNSLDQLEQLPMTTKDELVRSVDASGFSQHQTFAPDKYSRLHRTSGTKGPPLMILDTSDDWQWWSDAWQHVLTAAEIESHDRVMLTFSFGPFVGFWSAHEACCRRGALVIPAGGMSSLARLELLRQSRATVLACTPSYAQHLCEVALESAFDLKQLSIRRVLVAGEPGGSIPGVRQRIEDAWQAKVVDHCGATEVGPWGFGWPDVCGIHAIETHFIAELLPVDRLTGDGLRGELVLTSLGRHGAPVIRYRTGDLVRPAAPPTERCNFQWFEGGVIGRIDDMLIIRGVNIFPSSIDAILRQFVEVKEYRVTVSRSQQLDQLTVDVESPIDSLSSIRNRLEVELGLRIDVRAVEAGSLPRSEGKAQRWIDARKE